MSKKVLIIGAGSMGSSLAKGLAKSALNLEVVIHDAHPDKLDALKSLQQLKTIGEIQPADLDSDAIVLCIKPQDLPTFASQHGAQLKSKTILVSILAGCTIDEISSSLKFKGPIIRAMPNIAALYGAAATVLCSNDQSGESDKMLATQIFESVGTARWAKETHLNAVTGLSGSGPAYIYMIIESLSDGGVKMGLPRELASQLAAQTVLGAAVHVIESGHHPAILKEKVTTPGGTTINAVHELEKHGLRSMLISAVATASEHAGKLCK